jgi:hypothetical protein
MFIILDRASSPTGSSRASLGVKELHGGMLALRGGCTSWPKKRIERSMEGIELVGFPAHPRGHRALDGWPRHCSWHLAARRDRAEKPRHGRESIERYDDWPSSGRDDEASSTG